jgi:phosphoenolpyruvate carboxykinase (GTP)
MWPGFGENSRVLAWICGRVAGNAEAHETAIGLLPLTGEGGIDTSDLDVDEQTMARLLEVDTEGWELQLPQIKEHFAEFGDKLPSELRQQLEALEDRLNS